MTSPWLGEFLGTLILILLGDGVVAAVLLKKSKAEGSGMDCHHHGLGVCGHVRRLYGDRLRKQRRASESRRHTGIRRPRWCLWKIPALRIGAAARRSRRRRARVVAIFAALERNI